MIGLNLYCHFYKLMMVCVYHTYLPQHTALYYCIENYIFPF